MRRGGPLKRTGGLARGDGRIPCRIKAGWSVPPNVGLVRGETVRLWPGDEQRFAHALVATPVVARALARLARQPRRLSPWVREQGQAKRRRARHRKHFGAYAVWIRSLPCLVAHRGLAGLRPCWGRIEAAHVRGRGAHPEVPGEGNLVSLCTGHHVEQHAVGIRAFEKRYRISLLDKASEALQDWTRRLLRDSL